MTATPEVWKIASVTDAAQARAAVDQIATEGQAPALERARFLTSLTARLRRCLDQGGQWELLLHRRHNTAAQDGRLEAVLRPVNAPAPALGGDEAPLTCPLPHPPFTGRVSSHTLLPEALLRADENTAAILRLLQEQEHLVRLHREELHHTNQGVLALHSDLEAASLTQQELLQAEQAARAEAERARRLLTFLGDASAAITVSLNPTTILRRLSDLLVPDYAAQLDVWLFAEDNDHGQQIGEHAAAAVTAARTGRPQHAAPHPGNLPGINDLPPSALCPDKPVLAIPLIAHRLLGVLTLTAPGPQFDPDTCIMLVELARRVSIALDNARRYEQYRDTAETLQRAQLTDLPAVPGLLLAARYLPATLGLNIGGDWYDAFLQPDGSLVAVIGDVTGHGLRAAVVMGQLRTALRAYALEDTTPGEILTRLHRMVCHLQPELYATAMIARIRPGDPEVTWASAGHPPAMLRNEDGTVHVLNDKPGVMLGIPVTYTYADHTAQLPPGSSLMLYTDGLVERREHGIDPGIERLTHLLSALRTEEHDLNTTVEALLKPLLADSERDDDVCVLLCHALPPTKPEQATRADPPKAQHNPAPE
ncbi:PP2C family protein-serine/threonine phosphatase [Streptomyces galbus]|uniref:protein-serine/threonine phosphatase n=1 Tax=Streptomyces galbus TaxID=33898 RepID=A0A4U5WVN0_STRGB|nr:GAF domain-containing SpoIIE family protein phosphatase [Streptomyces galbus]TKT06568.1 GAF domain-containing protein [Streptomyces galbus]GHD54147.1 hypothetical protein GCM10010335_68310 [Streptomyces galbus]